MVQLKTFHLFAGAGGGILGDLLLRHRPVGAVEIEQYPREVLLARQRDGILPPFPVWDDVETFRRDNPECTEFIDSLRSIRNELCISGGFPCQDVSVAQWKQPDGLDGERSSLWVEMRRIISEVRPRYAFIENSPMLIIRGGVRVIGDLTEMGYDCRWGTIGASTIGAPHHRQRIWIVAHNREVGLQGDIEKEVCWQSTFQEWKAYRGIKDILRRSPVRSPRFCRVGDGVDSLVDRLAALGNGQVPQVARFAWELLNGELPDVRSE